METNTWSRLHTRFGLEVGTRSVASQPSAARPAAPRPDATAAGFRQTIGRYAVQRELSAGPMYRVLLAEDPLARRLVAVKTLRWEYVTNDNLAFCLARLDRQAQTAGRLCHPHIVKVFDRGSDFLVLEYLQGLSLSTILRDRGRMEVADALRVLAPLASALDHMHSRGVVHRDVQPGNVIVLADGSPRLIDFGASCLVDRPLETWDRLLGTPSHMAPEQVLHGVANAVTDVFSFGVLAYELLTGEPAFRGDSVGSVTYRVVYEKAPPPSRWTDGLPRVYDDIFARVLAKEPERRLSSAGAFVRALQGARDRRRSTTGAQAALQEEQARDLLRLQQSMPGPAPEACVVEVHTEPAGAQVFWNGVERGLTPLRVCESTAGPHTLKLVREGYTPVEAGFMVPDAPSLRLQFTMVPAASARLLEFRPRRDAETA
jgi:hypothetical protein